MEKLVEESIIKRDADLLKSLSRVSKRSVGKIITSQKKKSMTFQVLSRLTPGYFDTLSSQMRLYQTS